MNFSEVFIRRPVATSLLMLAVLIAGLVAYRLLPQSALPQVDYPTIQVTTLYPGASPDVITSSITAPLERQFGQMPGLDSMWSASSGGASVITLRFSLDLRLDVAEQQVQAAINAAATFLPQDLPAPPVYNKVNPADAPILTIALSSATMPLPKVQDMAETRVAQKISQVTGVGLVTLSGGQKPAVRVQVNPRALAAMGLSMEDVRIAISNQNVNQAKGSFDGSLRASTIDANDQLVSAAEYRRLVIAYRNGAPIRMADIARVVDGAENVRLAAWANQEPGIVLNVQRQPGANVIETVDRIKALLPQLQANLPAAVTLTTLTDRTITIRASVRDVQIELAMAVALVVMVIFLFLRSVPATIIPGVAVPLSLVGTFAAMYFAGFTINNLTLMALTIAAGFVVDDAIVMIENIARHLEEMSGNVPAQAHLAAGQVKDAPASGRSHNETRHLEEMAGETRHLEEMAGETRHLEEMAGETRHLEEMAGNVPAQAHLAAGQVKDAPASGQSIPDTIAMRAAIVGARQIGFTILSLTVSLIAVLIPLLFMREVVGRLFREFAITLAIAILISAIVSLTLTPMMCARLLKPESQQREPRWLRAIGRGFDHLVAGYARALDWVLARQGLVLWVAVATVVLTVALSLVVSKGFFPVQDTGAIQGITEASQTISFTAMGERQQALVQELIQDPAVESVASLIGVDGSNQTVNSGRLMINLKPLESGRPRAAALIPRLQERVSRIPGIVLYLQPSQDLTIDDRVSRTAYQFTLDSSDPAALSEWVPRLMERLQAAPQLRELSTDQQIGGLQAYVQIDRDAAARLGVTVAAIDNALYNAFGQRLVSTIFTQASQYRVVLETSPEFRRTPEDIARLYVPGNVNGVASQVPMASVAQVVERPAQLVINKLNQFPAATVYFNPAPGHSLGQAVEAIEAAQAEIGLPPSIRTQFQGASLAFKAALVNQVLLVLAAIVTMYIVLGVLYESYIHPVTILSTLPSAGIGALLALILTRNDLNVIAIIGIVLLIGIVKKNAIMMIDFALEAERQQGATPHEAIRQACLLRLRPILMTTMAALLGALPLMLGGGMGSELRQPLGLTMVGGLLVSQVLTLFTTPVIYLAFDRTARRWRARRQAPSA